MSYSTDAIKSESVLTKQSVNTSVDIAMAVDDCPSSFFSYAWPTQVGKRNRTKVPREKVN